MGYSFVLFDISLVISSGYFHCFFIGHTQNMYSPCAKFYFPVGKRSSGTATNSSANLELYLRHSSAIAPVVVNISGVNVPCSISAKRELYFRFFSFSVS